MNDTQKFFEYLEKQVRELKYGTLSVNVVLVNGVPKMKTLNVIRTRRTKYPKEKNPIDNQISK